MVGTKRGFSLTELLITIVILGILAKVTLMLWPGKSLNVYAEAERLASDIRYTQTLSISLSENYRLDFTKSTSYSILNQNGTALNTFAKVGANLVLPKTMTLQINASDKYLVFNPRGVPYLSNAENTLGNPLTTPLKITVSHGKETKTITITPETGYVEVGN